MKVRESKSSRWRGGLAGGGLLLGGLALAGCTHVITHSTPYYREGPYQIDPPQGMIDEGTYVWVMGHEGTYVRVWTEGFVDAYVPESAVRALWEKDDKSAPPVWTTTVESLREQTKDDAPERSDE